MGTVTSIESRNDLPGGTLGAAKGPLWEPLNPESCIAKLAPNADVDAPPDAEASRLDRDVEFRLGRLAPAPANHIVGL